ncbi:MAG: DUF853 family protein [Burkholderiales bacterium]|nr:DUF853 family protein [Burkholderiales bacterium]
MLFNDAPAALCPEFRQVVRLIRSKGVGVYFVDQNPWIGCGSGAAGNRVQRRLRLCACVTRRRCRRPAFRPNPQINGSGHH